MDSFALHDIETAAIIAAATKQIYENPGTDLIRVTGPPSSAPSEKAPSKSTPQAAQEANSRQRVASCEDETDPVALESHHTSLTEKPQQTEPATGVDNPAAERTEQAVSLTSDKPREHKTLICPETGSAAIPSDSTTTAASKDDGSDSKS